MNHVIHACIGLIFLFSVMISHAQGKSERVFIKNIILIDGTGRQPFNNANILIQGDTIAGINLKTVPEQAEVMDMQGKTIMPELINSHGHLGLLKGNKTASENYTRENVLRQLEKYQSYGVGAVLSMGTDYEPIFNWRDSSRAGEWPGAMIFTAGYGFGVPKGGPPFNFTEAKVFRPSTPEEAIQNVRQLAMLKPDIIKMWIDDFYGQYPTMKPEIYRAIISEAHKHGLRVAAHLFHLQDAKQLVDAGLDAMVHSIRDQEIDDVLLDEMKKKEVTYVPTLSLDEYQFIYTQNPNWLNDPFFKASLEPGVYEMITSKDYLDKLKSNPSFSKMNGYFQMALHNLFRIYKRGIKVAMGTDSGATPVRAQGFSEHLELELMNQAGLTPLEAITCATRNGAQFLHIDNKYGTLQKGKKANFMVLNGNPLRDIKNTRSIAGIWKDGVEVSKGPVQ
jgi:imidazolonepropionase-like amidohydrolase